MNRNEIQLGATYDLDGDAVRVVELGKGNRVIVESPENGQEEIHARELQPLTAYRSESPGRVCGCEDAPCCGCNP